MWYVNSKFYNLGRKNKERVENVIMRNYLFIDRRENKLWVKLYKGNFYRRKYNFIQGDAVGWKMVLNFAIVVEQKSK